ncbi:MAG: hypothetical protein ACTHP8_15325 [Bosea sp. (in: a-proteobacteria)]|uniref:hypothetical protein n=1 Tax=Bosea sp. (in: a-proteobacteria) TaxID=1871050 RepID=UPI003F7B4007
MKSGHGRLILREGIELPVGYCLLHSHGANGCDGILIGNIRSIDQKTFLKPIRILLDEGRAFMAHVVSHSERHIRFATNLGQLISRGKGRFRRRPAAPLTASR